MNKTITPNTDVSININGIYRAKDAKIVVKNKNNQTSEFGRSNMRFYERFLTIKVPASALAANVLPVNVKVYTQGDLIAEYDLTAPTAPPTGGGGTVDLTPVIERIEALEEATPPPVDLTPIEAKLEAIEPRLLPEDGSADMMLLRDPNGELVGKWAAQPVLNGKYKGTWSPDAELYYQDFGGGTVPAQFTVYDPGALGGNTLAVESMATNTGTDKPGIANTLKVNVSSLINSNNRRAGVQFDTSAVPALNGKTITRVVFYEAVNFASITGPKVFEILENNFVRKSLGAPATNGATTAWESHSVSFSSGSGPVQWQVRATGSSTGVNTIYLTGLQVFGSLEPYKRGDVVDHLGKFYRSEIDNNSSVPGTGNSWTYLPNV